MGNASSQVAAPTPQQQGREDASGPPEGGETDAIGPRTARMTSAAGRSGQVEGEKPAGKRPPRARSGEGASRLRRKRATANDAPPQPARGRPRDPSLLVPEAAAAALDDVREAVIPAEAVEEEVVAEVPPHKAGRKRTRESANGIVPFGTEQDGEIQPESQPPVSGKKGRRRRRNATAQGASEATRDVEDIPAEQFTAETARQQERGVNEGVEAPDEGHSKEPQRRKAKQATTKARKEDTAVSTMTADTAETHVDGRRTTGIGKLDPKKRKSSAAPLVAEAAQEGDAVGTPQAAVTSQKRKQTYDSPASLRTVHGIPETHLAGQTQKKPNGPASIHQDGRKISAIGQPGPPKRKKQKRAPPEPEPEPKLQNTQEGTGPQDVQASAVSPMHTSRAATTPVPTPTLRNGRDEPSRPPDSIAAAAVLDYIRSLHRNRGKQMERWRIQRAYDEGSQNLSPLLRLCDALDKLDIDYDHVVLMEKLRRGGLDGITAATDPESEEELPSLESLERQRRDGVHASSQRHVRPSNLDPGSKGSRKPKGVQQEPDDKTVENGHDDNSNDNDVDNDDGDDAYPGSERVTLSPISPDTQRKQAHSSKPNVERATRANLPEPVDEGPASGPFTDAEKAAADAVFDYVLQTSPEFTDTGQLKVMIADWQNAGEFKIEVQNALPNRTRAAVRKFCQRRYTAFEKGPWTAEQDELLRQAYATNPNKWVDISDMVGRRPEDCRDRYRNIVQYGSKMETGPWSAAEEAKLVTAVEECIETLKHAAQEEQNLRLASDREALEAGVDWKTVSAKLDGKRSMKRCREKWQALKRRKGSSNGDGPAPPIIDATPAHPDPSFDNQSKKQRAIESKFRLFQAGDYYDVLTEIHTAITDHTKVFHDESTVWSIVAQKNPKSRFSGALRRRAYYAALNHYNVKKVQRAQTIAAKAWAMARSLAKWTKKEGTSVDKMTRGYDPEKVRAEKEEERKAKEARRVVREKRAKNRDAKQKKVQKSEALVVESDEDSDDDDAGQDENGTVSANDEGTTSDDEANTNEAATTSDEVSSDSEPEHASASPTTSSVSSASSHSEPATSSPSSSSDESDAVKAPAAEDASRSLISKIGMSSDNAKWVEGPSPSLPQRTNRLLWPSTESDENRKKSQGLKRGR